MNDFLLQIKNLRAKVADKEILKGLNLGIKPGEIHAIMGPNGSGKSTLAQVLMGHPGYVVTEGEALFDNELGIMNAELGKERKPLNLLDLSPDERAKAGLFLAFQYPLTIPGVSLGNFLRQAHNSVRGEKLTPIKFKKLIQPKLDLLQMDEQYLERSVNDGFSGGEKKKAEILQLAVLEPRLAILDETDSGLDVDALRIVAEGVKSIMGRGGSGNLFIAPGDSANPLDQRGTPSSDLRRSPPDAVLGGMPESLDERPSNRTSRFNSPMSVLIITHYQRILRHIQPDFVHVMVDGRIVKSGDHELAEELEKEGYEKIIKN